MVETSILNLRYAIRRLSRSPLFTVIAALSLAIGLGATTAIFSLGNALLLRPIPGVQDERSVVDVGRTQAGRGFDTTSYPNYLSLRDRTQTLEGIYAYEIEPAPMSLGNADDAERVYGTVVSGNFFDVLGVQPRTGRLLQDHDDREGNPPVAVLSESLWQRRFGGDSGIVGRTVLLNSQPVTIVGVATTGFSGTTFLRADVWLPISAVQTAMPRQNVSVLRDRAGSWLMMGARLRPGVAIAQANAELATLGSNLQREFADANRGKSYRAAPVSQFPGRKSVVAGFVLLLMAIVGLILLIACVNLVSMLLARTAEREHENAVRLAIGASRVRIACESLTEVAVIFLLGSAGGLLLASWLLKLLLSVVPRLPVPVAVEPSMDWRVVSFAIALSTFAALLAGLAPAFHASSAGLFSALKTVGVDAGPGRTRLRDAFVVAQISMALLLVIVGGLFARALTRAAQVDPGFDQDRVEVVSLDLSLGRYNDTAGTNFLRELEQRVSALPNVESVSSTADLPLDGGRMGLGGLNVPGVPPPPGADSWSADANVVEPGVFRTLKLPLLRGRDFTSADTASSQPVVIINEAMATEIWPGQDPIGKQIEMPPSPDGTPGRSMRVVGLASNARLMSLNEPAEPYYYVPLAQLYLPRMSLLVRLKDESSAIPQIRRIVRAMNPNLPLVDAMPLSSITALELIPQRIAATAAVSLGSVGMLLAAIGIYGVTAFAVNRRRREIAIRIALGADNLKVVRFVLRHTLVLTGLGLSIGLMLASASSQVLNRFLFGLSGLDALAFLAAIVFFAAVTAAACYVPARRATSVDPMVTLRSE